MARALFCRAESDCIFEETDPVKILECREHIELFECTGIDRFEKAFAENKSADDVPWDV